MFAALLPGGREGVTLVGPAAFIAASFRTGSAYTCRRKIKTHRKYNAMYMYSASRDTIGAE